MVRKSGIAFNNATHVLLLTKNRNCVHRQFQCGPGKETLTSSLELLSAILQALEFVINSCDMSFNSKMTSTTIEDKQ